MDADYHPHRQCHNIRAANVIRAATSIRAATVRERLPSEPYRTIPPHREDKGAVRDTRTA